MEKFSNLKSIPSYLSLQNIDTDMIIPKQFLKTIKRTGLGKSLFYEMRYDETGKINSDFILNKEPYNKSKILLALFLFDIKISVIFRAAKIPSPVLECSDNIICPDCSPPIIDLDFFI